MKRLQKTLLDLLGSMGRMKVKGLPRALVITIMLLIIGSIFFIPGSLELAVVGKRPRGPASPEYADPDHHQHGVRGRYRLHREIPD